MRFQSFSFQKEAESSLISKFKIQNSKFRQIALVLLFSAVILSPIYAQESTEEILFVKSVSLAPSTMIVSPQKAETPKVIKGVIFPGVPIAAIKKINYSLKTSQGAVVWERTMSPSPKGQTLPFIFDLSNSPLQKELILNAELLIAGDVVISNTDTSITFVLETEEGESAPFVLSEISDIEITPQEDALDVSFQFQNNNAAEEFKAVVLLQSKDTNASYSQLKQSELVKVGAGKNNTYSVSFEKPTQPQLYTLSAKVLDQTELAVTGNVSREWFLKGAIAKVENISLSPLRTWKAGENITLSFEGSTNMDESLEALIQIRSLAQAEEEWLVSETISITPDKEIFSHDYTFSVEESTLQLTAKVTLSLKGEILHERQFVSPVFATEGIAEQAIVKMEQLSKKLKTISPKQKLAALGGGVALVLLLLLFIILAVRSRKKKNTINLFLIALMAVGFAANAQAEQVSILYPYFAEEQFTTGASVTHFNTIPFRGVLFDTISGGAFDPDASTVSGIVRFTGPATYDAPFTFDFQSEIDFSFELSIGGAGANLPDGDYNVVILFQSGINPDFHTGTVAVQWGEQADSSIKLITVDGTPPSITTTLTPLLTTPTNQPIQVSLDYTDAGVGVENESADVFSVDNNFCDDSELCSTEIGYRTVRVCDKVGNCQEEMIEITNYDVLPPTFSFGSGVLNQQKAKGSFEIVIINVDEPVQAPIPGKYVCSSSSHFFYNATSERCEEPSGKCALSVTARGIVDRVTDECLPMGCGDGYVFNSDTLECEMETCTDQFPLCFPLGFDGSCEITQWDPSPSIICDGEIFEQISNCGGTRNSAGTKTDGACAPIATGLIAHYLFDNGVGTDISGQNNHGTLSGPTPTTGRDGTPDKALYFDGVDDYIEVLSSATMDSTSENAITFTTWLKPHTDAIGGLNDFSSLFRKTLSEIQSNQGGYYAYIKSDNTSDYHPLFCQNFGCSGSMTYSPIPKGGTWHHIAITIGVNESVVSYYVDGVLISPQSSSLLSEDTSGKSFYFAKPTSDGSATYYKGAMDDTRIYNAALTAAEILAIYDSEVSIACVSDLECNDGDSATMDTCVDPGTAGAVCENILVKSVLYQTNPVSGTDFIGRQEADNVCQLALPAELVCGNIHAFLSVNSNDEIRDMPSNYGYELSSPVYKFNKNFTFIKSVDNWNQFFTGTEPLFLEDAFSFLDSNGNNAPFDWWSGTSNTGAVNDVCWNALDDNETAWGVGDLSGSRFYTPAQNEFCTNNNKVLLCMCDPTITATPLCSSDAECDDGDSATTDTCVNPGMTNSDCTHEAANCSAGSGLINNFGGYVVSGVTMGDLTWTWPMIESGGSSDANSVSASAPISNGSLGFTFGSAYCQNGEEVQFTGGTISTTVQCNLGFQVNGITCVSDGGCIPKTCTDYQNEINGAVCGTWPDECGVNIYCGSCPSTVYQYKTGTSGCESLGKDCTKAFEYDGTKGSQISCIQWVQKGVAECSTSSPSGSCSCCTSGETQCITHSTEASNYTTESACLGAYQTSYETPCFSWK